MFGNSNLIIPSTLNPNLIFYFAFGFAPTLGPNFSFNLVTDLDFDYNFKFQFHILTYQQDLAHI